LLSRASSRFLAASNSHAPQRKTARAAIVCLNMIRSSFYRAQTISRILDVSDNRILAAPLKIVRIASHQIMNAVFQTGRAVLS
jgi:hypothetical protein